MTSTVEALHYDRVAASVRCATDEIDDVSTEVSARTSAAITSRTRDGGLRFRRHSTDCADIRLKRDRRTIPLMRSRPDRWHHQEKP